jgi:hypothetical protein
MPHCDSFVMPAMKATSFHPTGDTTVMAKAKPSDVLLPLTEEVRRDLVVRFLAEVMQMTSSPDKQEDFQVALQAYCDSLQPWLDPSDGPPNPRAVFSLLDGCSFDESGENVTVVLSPEAEALFRAWLRRNKIWDNTGLNTAHAWSN